MFKQLKIIRKSFALTGLHCRGYSNELWNLGTSNGYIFKVKDATELETPTKIYFSLTFNLA